MLAKLKLLLGISDTSKDDLLNLLLDEASDWAMAYTHTTATTAYTNVVVRIASIRYKTLGSEGLTGESYSGLSFSYADDLPAPIYKELQAYRKVRVITDDSE